MTRTSDTKLSSAARTSLAMLNGAVNGSQNLQAQTRSATNAPPASTTRAATDHPTATPASPRATAATPQANAPATPPANPPEPRAEPRPEAATLPEPASCPLPLAAGCRPWLTGLALAGSDFAMLSVAMLAAVYGRWMVDPVYNPAMYLQLWPLLGLSMAGYAAMHLYPAVPFSPTDELRRLTLVTTLVCLGLAALTFLTGEAHEYSRAVLLSNWALALLLVPLGRAVLRDTLAHRPWWGDAALVLGHTATGARIVRTLQRRPSLGLKPVAIIGEAHQNGEAVDGVPVIGGLRRARGLGRRYGMRYAIVAMPHMANDRLGPLLERLSSSFHHLIFVPELPGFSSLWITGVDMGGTLGLEVRHRLLDPGRRTLKRVVDVLLVLASAPLVLPVVGLIALAVRLDSPGPAFYGAPRIGVNGRWFTMCKFRSMVHDADEVLQRTLANNPDLRAEWEANHKLRDDPRVTRVGAWLRKTSLDELPQLWNVLKGEMSLVGPRPILEDGVDKYGQAFALYKKVLPGLTGMWQVSGRNELTYEERVQLDAYYVRNWSLWLDIYIFACTFPAVFRGRGAY